MSYKKEWIPNMRNKNREKTSKRPEILQIATEYYQNLYQSCKSNQEMTKYNSADTETEKW